MSESEIPVNPHGDYHEEDDSKVEEILDSEVEQATVIPNGMKWIQEAFAAIRMDMQAQGANLQAQLDLFGTRLAQNLPNMIKQEVDKVSLQRPESVSDAEVQASILDKISVVSSKINSMELQLASVEDLGQRTLHTYDKEIEVIKYDQNHLLYQVRCQSESAERESRRVYARFDALEANLPKMVADVLAARPEAAPDEVVPDQAQGYPEAPPRVRQSNRGYRDGRCTWLRSQSCARTKI